MPSGSHPSYSRLESVLASFTPIPQCQDKCIEALHSMLIEAMQDGSWQV
jgi:hypothetical protein